MSFLVSLRLLLAASDRVARPATRQKSTKSRNAISNGKTLYKSVLLLILEWKLFRRLARRMRRPDIPLSLSYGDQLEVIAILYC